MPGTQSESPYLNYNTGVLEAHNHNINASFTQVWKTNLTSQSKVVWNQVDDEQPVNGAAEPRLMMNPDRLRCASRGIGSPFRATCRGTPATTSRQAARRSCCSYITTRPG